MISTQKQPSCIKRVWPSKSLGEKNCAIKYGGHEMAAMIWMIIMALCINKIYYHHHLIAAISWPPPLISQKFSPVFLKAAPFCTAWFFFVLFFSSSWISLLFVV